VKNVLKRFSANNHGRFALWLLVASLLIPLGTTTLRGMHHLVSCIDEIDQTFAVTAIDQTNAVITGSTSVVRTPPTGDCSAVEMNMRVQPDSKGFVLIDLPVENKTDRTWIASVILQLDGLKTSVPVGRVQPGDTKNKTVRVRLTKDLRSITGTLIVGP
jgi:hypothetical protein